MSGRARRNASQTFPRLGLSTTIDRSRNSSRRIRPREARPTSSLGPADRRNFVRGVFGAPQVAGRHRGDRDGAALLLQKDQRSGTLKLDVVGMRVKWREYGADRVDWGNGANLPLNSLRSRRFNVT